VIFRVKRPAYLINSSMTIEDGQGQALGEVQQRWHLLKRNYDLYMDKVQFAAIRGERSRVARRGGGQQARAAAAPLLLGALPAAPPSSPPGRSVGLPLPPHAAARRSSS
jgi:hypothetical protein